ncbi:MAG: DUF4276 family protein [Terracidiphilus sp.]
MRLHFVVEGQTEETFVRDILAPEFGAHRIYCDAHRITTGRRKGVVYRGGLIDYLHLRKDLDLWMRQDGAQDSWFTTMVDFYQLPPEFPGFEESKNWSDPYQRVSFLESKLKEDIDYWRFIPYVQLHEFESLLFADPSSFSLAFPDIGAGVTTLQEIRDRVGNPELIDEGLDTHPSKQICRVVPQYAKASAGPLIAKQIGLPTLRQECQHFAEWISIILSCAAD